MFFKKSKPADTAEGTVVKSEQSNVAPSESVSVSEIEKELTTVDGAARSTSSSESKHKVETTGLEEVKALDRFEDDTVYPTGAKLAFITFALSLSVFLMALVCVVLRHQFGMG